MAFVLEKIRPIRRGRREASRSAGKTVIERLGRLAVATLKETGAGCGQHGERGDREHPVRQDSGSPGFAASLPLGLTAVLLSPWEIDVLRPEVWVSWTSVR